MYRVASLIVVALAAGFAWLVGSGLSRTDWLTRGRKNRSLAPVTTCFGF